MPLALEGVGVVAFAATAAALLVGGYLLREWWRWRQGADTEAPFPPSAIQVLGGWLAVFALFAAAYLLLWR